MYIKEKLKENISPEIYSDNYFKAEKNSSLIRRKKKISFLDFNDSNKVKYCL